ncbi:hypothetical protein GCM10020331_092060 [Ectobacillus funiculus]
MFKKLFDALTNNKHKHYSSSDYKGRRSYAHKSYSSSDGYRKKAMVTMEVMGITTIREKKKEWKLFFSS